MAFNYNNEVIDLLFKKTLGTTYTTSNLVPGQEIPLQPKIHNEQIFGEPIPNDTIRNLTSINKQQLNARSDVDKVRTYNPNETARTTLKEQNLYNKDPTNIAPVADFIIFSCLKHSAPKSLLNPSAFLAPDFLPSISTIPMYPLLPNAS